MSLASSSTLLRFGNWDLLSSDVSPLLSVERLRLHASFAILQSGILTESSWIGGVVNRNSRFRLGDSGQHFQCSLLILAVPSQRIQTEFRYSM